MDQKTPTPPAPVRLARTERDEHGMIHYYWDIEEGTPAEEIDRVIGEVTSPWDRIKTALSRLRELLLP